MMVAPCFPLVSLFMSSCTRVTWVLGWTEMDVTELGGWGDVVGVVIDYFIPDNGYEFIVNICHTADGMSPVEIHAADAIKRRKVGVSIFNNNSMNKKK